MTDYKQYWEDNIEKWARFYQHSETSTESFQSKFVVKFFYSLFILPIERRLMGKRHEIVKEIINRNFNRGNVVLDAGSGTGIYSVYLAYLEMTVIAIDFSEKAIEIARESVTQHHPNIGHRIKFVQGDVTKLMLPPSDGVLMIGVSPYIVSLDFLVKVTANTNSVIFHYLSSANLANKIRGRIKWLNVRKVHTFNPREVQNIFINNNFYSSERVPIGTGFVEVFKRG